MYELYGRSSDWEPTIDVPDFAQSTQTIAIKATQKRIESWKKLYTQKYYTIEILIQRKEELEKDKERLEEIIANKGQYCQGEFIPMPDWQLTEYEADLENIYLELSMLYACYCKKKEQPHYT